jgi:hypothetical protein
MNKPFNVGDKVRCIKRGGWNFGAGLGKAVVGKPLPVFGEIYTVAHIGNIVSEPEASINGVEWVMTLAEFPHIADSEDEKDQNIFSCRRFEKI